MRDEDPDVKRAVAWILREMGKREPQTVFNFLREWSPGDNRHTRWIIRQGMKKLPPDMQAELEASL